MASPPVADHRDTHETGAHDGPTDPHHTDAPGAVTESSTTTHAAVHPATAGERQAQRRYGTTVRADRFYDEQMRDRLTERMVAFLARQTQLVVATVDATGRPDASVRFGEPGFVAVVDERTVAWPELRGNGVMTTLGNLGLNPAVHLMFLDADERIGLHLRGDAVVLDAADVARSHPALTARPHPGRSPERWVVVALETSYIHCRKHFPRSDGPVEWGTDDSRAKGGDYFGARELPSPWAPEKHLTADGQDAS